MTGELDSKAVAAPAESAASATTPGLERREALRRFGVYAAVAAPVLTVLMASRQSEAGGFFRNGSTGHGGGGGGGGLGGLGGGGGGGGFGGGGGGFGGGGGLGGGGGGGGGGGFSL